ncbi:MAG: OmpA family protein [Alphaproteobacteria bacterium]|nr:OmpA family protein [Alphaproteobacteria bacterium]
MIAWVALALAAPRGDLEVAVRQVVGFGANRDIPTLVGVGGSIAYAPWKRFQLEAAIDGGGRWGRGAWFGVGPRVRWFLGPPEKPALSLLAGGGIEIAPGTPGFVAVGAAMDALKSEGPRPRLQFEYLASPGGESRGLLSVGMQIGRRGPPPPPEPEPVIEPTRVDARGMVWVPDPVCQWLPTDEANAELERLSLQLPEVHVISEALLRGPDRAGDQAARLFVAGSPGDRVTVDGVTLDLAEGYAWTDLPEGRADVVATGGGRTLSWPVGLADGHVVWLVLDGPEATRIRFGPGSAVLTPESRARIAEVARLAGDWTFDVHGSASPEGTENVNRDLEARRARAVADALIAAGVAAERVRVGASRAYPDLSPEDQRAAVILPVEAP